MRAASVEHLEADVHEIDMLIRRCGKNVPTFFERAIQRVRAEERSEISLADIVERFESALRGKTKKISLPSAVVGFVGHVRVHKDPAQLFAA